MRCWCHQCLYCQTFRAFCGKASLRNEAATAALHMAFFWSRTVFGSALVSSDSPTWFRQMRCHMTSEQWPSLCYALIKLWLLILLKVLLSVFLSLWRMVCFNADFSEAGPSIYRSMYTVLQSTKTLWLHTDTLHLINHVTSKPTPPDCTCHDLNTY